MIKKNHQYRTKLNTAWRAIIVLIVCIGFTTFASYYTKVYLEKEEIIEFQLLCADIKTKISTRLYAHAQLLRSGSAFFSSADSVLRDDWRNFYEHAHISKNLPGIQGLGYVQIIPKNQLKTHIQSVREQGFPNYAVYPDGDRSVYSSVVYLEPFVGRNLRAFGYDMLSEPVRRKAMEIARDSNIAMLSGKVKLVQETNNDVQFGTLMYVPVYRHNSLIETVDQRRAAIVGWVYSPYRMNDLMEGILGRWDIIKHGRIHLHVYDNNTISTEALLYDSQRFDSIIHNDKSALIVSTPVEFNGKYWTLLFKSRYEHSLLFHSKVLVVFIMGCVISFLLFFLTLSLFNTRFRAQKIAEQLTSEIKESEAKSSAILHTLPDMMFIQDINGVYIDFFVPQNVKTFVPPKVFLGQRMENVLPPDVVDRFIPLFKKAIETNQTQFLEYTLVMPDRIRYYEARTIAFEINKVLSIVRDITARKDAEEQLEQIRKNYETFFNTIDDFLFVLDEQANIIHVNETVRKRLEYSDDELRGLSVLMVHPAERREEAARIVGEMLEGKTDHCPVPLISKTGKIILVETRVSLGQWDGQPALFGVTKDVSKLKLSEERFSKAFNNSATIMAISVFDTGKFIEVNQIFLDTFNLKRDDVIGKTSIELNIFSKENRDKIKKESYSGKKITNLEVDIRFGEKLIYGLFSADVIYIQDTKCWLTVMQNITERKKAEQTIKEALNMQKLLLDNISAGVVIIDADTHIVENINEAGCELFGDTSENITGKRCFNYLCVNGEGNCPITDNDQDIENAERDLLQKNGNRLPILKTVKRIVINEKNKLIETFIDISSLKKIETELKQLATRLSLATNAGGVGIWDWDIVNNNLIWDDQMYALYGITKDTFSGAYDAWVAGLHPDDKVRGDDEIQMAINGEKEFNTEFRVLWPDKSIHTIRALAIVQRDESGNALHIVGTNWDITTQKQNEQALIKSKIEADSANKAKSEFLANMSHEIRTPMNAILGFSEALYHKLDSKQHQNMVKSILNGGNLLMSLLNDILDLSKIEAGKLDISPQPVDLNNLLQEIIMLFKEKAQVKGVDLFYNLSSGFPTGVMLDEIRIKQVFFNLVGNAIKFTHKGYVKIHLFFEYNSEDNGQLTIDVEDTGIGIPESQQQIIFESFRQQSGQSNREYGGTGLGLAISKRLVEKMNGTISVASKVGDGSIFKIVFSEMKTTNIETIAKDDFEIIQNITFEKASILVVDDIATNIEAIENLLSDTNITVLSAENGDLALEILKNSSPDLIMLDMRMPGKDGYEMAKIIKNNTQYNHIPIIAYTASVHSSSKIDDSGNFNGLLWKPVKRSELFNQLCKFLKYKVVVDEVDDTVSNEINYLITDEVTISKLPEIVNILKDNYLKEWELIKDSYILFKIEEFANKLLAIARENKIIVLMNYSNEIKENLENLNLDDLKRTLYQFPDIIEKLNRQVKM